MSEELEDWDAFNENEEVPPHPEAFEIRFETPRFSAFEIRFETPRFSERRDPYPFLRAQLLWGAYR